MSDLLNQDLGRVQTESHIPTSTWRQWCTQLGLDVGAVVDVWDEVARPLLLATQQLPDIAFILQLRALDSETDILTFRDRAAVVLHCLGLVESLADDSLSDATGRRALLRLHRHALAREPEGEAGSDYFTATFCAAVLVTCLLSGQSVNLAAVVKVLAERCLTDLLQLGLKSARTSPYPEAAACLQACGTVVGEPVGTSADHDDASPDEEIRSADSALASCLAAFREAMDAIYAAGRDADLAHRDAPAQPRSDSIRAFDPAAAYIPTLEEALAVQRENSGASAQGRQQALGKAGGAGPSRAAASCGSATGSAAGGTTTARSGGTGKGRVAGASPRAVGGGASAPPKAAGDATGGRPVETAKAATAAALAVQVRAARDTGAAGSASTEHEEGAVLLENARAVSIGEIALQVGQYLASLQKSDTTVWRVLVDPLAEIPDLPEFAQAVSSPGTERAALDTLQAVAAWMSVKPLLEAQEDRRLNPRSLDREIEAYVQFVGKKAVDASSRVLIPLPRILDHAGAALVRLRALDCCLDLLNGGDAVTAQQVADSCGAAMAQVTRRVDERELLTKVWDQVLLDAETLLNWFASEELVESCCDYARALDEAGHLASLEKLAAALDSKPLILDAREEDADAREEDPDAAASQVPQRLLQDAGLGEIIEQLRQHLFAALARSLPPTDAAAKIYDQLDRQLRPILARRIAPRPRRERHNRRPRLALAVASLAQVTGNPELSDLFVRLNPDDQIHFVEDYADGRHVDLFELRRNTQGQMHARARIRSSSERTAELQPGVNYLYTIGRTDAPFGASRGEVMAGCVRDDEDELMLFPMF